MSKALVLNITDLYFIPSIPYIPPRVTRNIISWASVGVISKLKKISRGWREYNGKGTFIACK